MASSRRRSFGDGHGSGRAKPPGASVDRDSLHSGGRLPEGPQCPHGPAQPAPLRTHRIGGPQARTEDVRATQLRLPQRRAVQHRAPQIRSGEVAVDELGAGQVGEGHQGEGQARPREPGGGQPAADEDRAVQVQPGEVAAGQQLTWKRGQFLHQVPRLPHETDPRIPTHLSTRPLPFDQLPQPGEPGQQREEW